MLDVCNECSTDKRKRHDNVDERLRVAIDLRLCVFGVPKLVWSEAAKVEGGYLGTRGCYREL